jgi:hypothetical protein
MKQLERKQAVIRVAQRFMQTPIDEIVSLEALSAAAGVDVRDNRWIIGAAQRAINADYGAVFATVRSEGYRRLANAEGTLFAGARGLYRIRRASRAGIRMAHNAAKHANDMTAEQRRRHHQQMASLGLIAHLTMARTVAAMSEDPPPPPPTDPLGGLRQALGL